MSAVADRPHYLYRHYDADGDLLYIGCTSRPQDRPQDPDGRPWMSQSVRCEVTGPLPFHAAREAERAAILREQPRHNWAHTNRSRNDTSVTLTGDSWGLTPKSRRSA